MIDAKTSLLPRLAILIPLACLSSPVFAENFQRGDSNADGVVNITDAVTILLHLFTGASALECEDAADIDDSGALNISDPINLLDYLFRGGPAPPAPHGTCGDDPTLDELGCLAFSPCLFLAPCSEEPRPLDPPAVPFSIDWPSFFNWQAGRAWQFQTTAGEESYSEYVKEHTTHEGQDAYVLGWSSNWSDQLDYWYLGPSGAHLTGFFDEERRVDVPICPSYQLPNTVELGKEFSQEVQRGDEHATIKITISLVESVSVPFGTFKDVLEIKRKTSTDIRLDYYANGVGHIKEYKTSSDRTDELLEVTDGNAFRPPN